MRIQTQAQYAAVGSILMLILTACSGATEHTADAPVREQSTSLVLPGYEPPHYNYTESDSLAIQGALMLNVIEPLLERMEDGSLESLLAKSFEVSDDGREYTFTIRDATFHDGSKLTADDVVYSLELNRNASNTSVSSPLKTVSTIEKIDDHTVRVTLSEPSQQFLEAMSRDTGMIIPENGAEKLEQTPVGTGPFAFSKWRHGIDVTLTRFDDYWGDLPYFKAVTFRTIEDPNAQMNAVLAGDLDLAGIVDFDRISDVEASDGFRILEQIGQEIYYVSVNAGEEIFADERIRQAVAYAIDRDEIIQAAAAGYGNATCVLVNPPNVPWHSDYCPYPYNPSRARELLTEAGADGLTFELKYPTVGNFSVIVEILVSQLAKVGITAEPRPRDFPTYLDEVLTGEPPAYQATALAGSQQIDQWTCPGWFTRDCVESFDKLLTDADASTDRGEWATLRRQAVELHADRAFLIPIYNASQLFVLRDDLAGFKPYSSYVEIDLRHLHWKE